MVALAAALMVVLLVAACGGGDDGTTEPGSTTAATEAASDTAAPAETGGAASGEPILVGLMNQDLGPIGIPSLSAGAVAAADFVNGDLGGVDGRPLELVKCSTDGTPESAARCGTLFVDENVVAVVDLFDLASGPLHPILDEAGIPIIGGAAQVPEDFTSENSFWLTSGGQGYISGAVAFLANQPGVEKITYLALDLPTLDRDSKEYIDPVAQAEGVEVEVIPYDFAATDFAPIVASGLRSDPDAMFIFTSDQGTPPLIQAVRNAGFTGPFVAGASTAFADALPGDAGAGVSTMVGLYNLDDPEAAPEDKRRELDEFVAAMDEYAPDEPKAALQQVGFSLMMTAYNLFVEIGADELSPAAITAALKADVDREKYMGRTYNCVTNSIADNVGLCAREVAAITWDGTRFTSNDWFDGVSLTEQ